MFRNTNGTISIFFACILMTLIVFCCSIVDGTRIHMAKIEAERALYLANQSILASFDSQLADQYGIFARKFPSYSVQNEIQYYINGSLNPKSTSSQPSQLLQFLQPQSEKFFNLYNFNIKGIVVEESKSIINADYMRYEILQFMKFRAPLLGLEPLFEKLELLEKLSKTTEIISEKNKLVSNIQIVQNHYRELEKLVDGLTISEIGNVDEQNGKPQAYFNYVKRLVTDDFYPAPLYDQSQIPDELWVNELNENAYYIDEELQQYEESLIVCEDALKEIVEIYKDIEEAKEEKNETEERLLEFNNELSKKDSVNDIYLMKKIMKLYDQLNDLNKRIDQLNDELEGFGNQFNKNNERIFAHILPAFNQLLETYDENYSIYGLYGIHHSSLMIIDEIKSQLPMIQNKISLFKEVLENQDKSYLDSTCQNLSKEIKNYEKLLGFSGNHSMINNLAMMEGKLAHNQEVLLSTQQDIEFLRDSEQKLHNYWLYRSTEGDEELIQSICRLKNTNGHTLLNLNYSRDLKNGEYTTDSVIQSLKVLENKLDDYQRDLHFDYSNMGIQTVSGFDFNDFISQFSGSFSGIDLPHIGKVIVDNKLPSHINSSTSPQAEVEEPISMSSEGSNQILEQLSRISNKVVDFGTQLRDEIYINEYIIGMFQSAVDHEITSKEDSITLNNYPKSDHYLNYEVEYILFGNPVEQINLAATVSIIFAIRVALNMIHLISNGDKMNRITTAANAIAGWWTLGIGSIIVTIVLTLAWAIAESVVDIQNLLKNEEVPLIKTTETWETDIISSIIDIAEESTEEMIEDTRIEHEIQHIPSLQYQDYLRLLLIGGIVNNEIKMYRILDIIQLNISKDRNCKENINQYISSFSTQAEIEVNYLFFTLPFMPKEAKDLGEVFKFKCNAEVAY